MNSFSIWNRFGRIDFIGNVDLTEVDLNRHVKINHRSVELYEDLMDGE